MAKIIVNNELELNGKITIRRFFDENSKLHIEGSMATHFYVEEINTLETSRFLIRGINVQEEVYGSEDYDILYNFTASFLDIKGKYTNLNIKDIKCIENKMYSENGYMKTSILNTDNDGDKNE